MKESKDNFNTHSHICTYIQNTHAHALTQCYLQNREIQFFDTGKTFQEFYTLVDLKATETNLFS